MIECLLGQQKGLGTLFFDKKHPEPQQNLLLGKGAGIKKGEESASAAILQDMQAVVMGFTAILQDVLQKYEQTEPDSDNQAKHEPAQPMKKRMQKQTEWEAMSGVNKHLPVTDDENVEAARSQNTFEMFQSGMRKA